MIVVNVSGFNYISRNWYRLIKQFNDNTSLEQIKSWLEDYYHDKTELRSLSAMATFPDGNEFSYSGTGWIQTTFVIK